MTKRILVVIIAITLIMSLSSCVQNPQAQSNQEADSLATSYTTSSEPSQSTTVNIQEPENTPQPLYAGYSRVSITPAIPATLKNGMANRVEDDLYATVISLKKGESTVLLITTDLKFAGDPILALTFRVAKEFGINEDQVIVASTHTHSAINYTDGITSDVAVWLKVYRDAMRKAIGESLDDLNESTVYIGRSYPKGLAFTRRYIMKDGSFKGIHTNNPSNDYARHETEADNEMQVIRFNRTDAKDIVLANWQAHPTKAPAKSISSDYIHTFRETAETLYNVHFAFFLGASGNIAQHSSIRGEAIYNNCFDLGRALATHLNTALKKMTEVSTDELRFENLKVDMTVDHSFDHLREKANKVLNEKNQNEKKRLIKEYGFQSEYEAIAIETKASLGDTQPFSMTVISFGDIAFIAAPYEMFDSDGKIIKERSPFEMTFVVTCANGNYLYIAPEWAYQNGGYEVYRTVFIKGTAEKLLGVFLDMLNKQYT